MLLDDIATYLAAQSTAFTVFSGSAGNLAKSIALDVSPAPNTVTVLYETPGTAPGFSFSTAANATVEYESPTLQILSRSTSYETARDRAQTAYTTLNGLAATLPTSTGVRYLSIAAAQPPFLLQRDEHDRYIVAVNFNVQKEVG